jgi:transcriptional regulator with XRE-family HTH domain
MKTMGSRLALLRGDVDQAVIAEAVGISRPHLANLEKDRGTPSLDVAVALARHFRVSLDWLVAGRGPRTVDPRAMAALDALAALSDEERDAYLRIIFARASAPEAAA